jgi:hypothetical protein
MVYKESSPGNIIREIATVLFKLRTASIRYVKEENASLLLQIKARLSKSSSVLGVGMH